MCRAAVDRHQRGAALQHLDQLSKRLGPAGEIEPAIRRQSRQISLASAPARATPTTAMTTSEYAPASRRPSRFNAPPSTVRPPLHSGALPFKFVWAPSRTLVYSVS